MAMLFGHPGFYSVVAEEEGAIVGSNFLDERSEIAGVGPITISPKAQNRRVGRTLMEDVMRRAEERGFAGVRLLQATYHTRSLSLYSKLGFETRALIATIQGPALQQSIPGYLVRPATPADLESCSQLCTRVHGHNRTGELADAVQQGTATVVERDDRITGYSSGVGFFGHSVAETNEDLKALIAAAPAFPGSGFLLPTGNGEVFRWCLDNGVRG
ncbi:MAG: GNAT family N-acetyltransferase, partial [Verrucomicrobia bacterium]|nr:GNAT family N-acetyltransferase [Verrucomicrobiota bacterium]